MIASHVIITVSAALFSFSSCQAMLLPNVVFNWHINFSPKSEIVADDLHSESDAADQLELERGVDKTLLTDSDVHIQTDADSKSTVKHRVKPSATTKPIPKCGYQGCDLGEAGMLNVHLVPHSHDDVGWLKTVDQYYYGGQHPVFHLKIPGNAYNNIQWAGVQYILDTVVQVLSADSKKRFIFVEIAFFARWWDEQHDAVRHVVRRLVNEGRFEFILGGWCMNDEATTHYNAIIDQHTFGFRFLQQNFGECGRPKIAWQIDPFGHSREQASLFAQFGFDGLFFSRLDYQDKEKRLKNKEMEFMWMASDNLGKQASLLTAVTYDHYMAPAGFCFDTRCDDPPIMDDERLDDYNVDERVKKFLKVVLQQATNFTTNHIMLTMGGDFEYSNAHLNYKNMDKLIKYVNSLQAAAGSRVNLLYSTPSCYLYALNRANRTYSVKRDDFFPYADRPHTFWTGYFTNRPALKQLVRNSNAALQVCKQLDVLAQLEAVHGSKMKLDIFRKALAVAQHHDAVTGTEKQPVAYDYAMRLSRGAAACEEVLNSAYSKLVAHPGGQILPTQIFCDLLNISFCQITEDNDKFTVLLYNPIGRPVEWWVRLPVTKALYAVQDANLQTVDSQMIKVSAETKRIPEANGSRAANELVFKAKLPALGFTTYFVTAKPALHTKAIGRSEVPRPFPQSADVYMKNKYVSVQFDGSTGRLKSLANLDVGLTVAMQQGFAYYRAFWGNNTQPRFQASGAYVFRPNGSQTVNMADSVKVSYIKGRQVQEMHQVLSSWASQVVRLYEGERFVEFEWTVGPIPINDSVGKEVISWFQTDLDTAATFYTDANGREILKRVRNYRPTWKLNQTENISGNYYPVNSRIYIRDELKKIQLTILTDRSQGGASIHDGQLELMVHRRLLADDNLGVGEPTNETGLDGRGLIVRGKHYVLLDRISDSGRHHRDLAERLFMAPTMSFSSLKATPSSYKSSFNTDWSGLKRALPDNVHLLTLEQWEGRTFLLRLEHFYERGEDEVLSKPAKVSLKDLFVPFRVVSVVELALGGDRRLDGATRLTWNIAGHGRTPADMSAHVAPIDNSTLTIELQPMQIRTFQVTIQ